jgi:hypothetical protein
MERSDAQAGATDEIGIQKREAELQTRIWSNFSLRKRLLLPIAAMILGALVSGALALQIFSPDQFEYESEQEAGSAQVVATALNAALATARNPEQALDAFVRGLGRTRRSGIFRQALSRTRHVCAATVFSPGSCPTSRYRN